MIHGIIGNMGTYGARLAMQGVMDNQSAQIQHMYGQLSAEAAQERQKELMQYAKKLNSPTEQLKALQEAGLSVSVLDNGGLGGQGGTPSAPEGQMPSINGGQVENFSDMVRSGIGIFDALHQGKLNALEIEEKEIRNKLLQEELDDKQGVERELKNANLNKLLGETKNKELMNKGLELDNEDKRINNEIQKATKEWQIQKAYSEVEEMAVKLKLLDEQLQREVRNNKMDEEMYQTTINLGKQQLINLIGANAVQQATLRKINSETDLIEINKGIKELEGIILLDKKDAYDNDAIRLMKKQYNEMMNKGGINTVLGGMFSIGANVADILINTNINSLLK